MTLQHHNDGLRVLIRHRREGLTADWVEDASRRVLASLLSLPAFTGARTVAAYLSMPDEVQTRAAIRLSRTRGARILVPAWERDAHRYRFCDLEADMEIVEGPFRVPEPRPIRRADLPADACVLVPGVAFTREGFRLGHGKGHYDRLLQGHPGPKIGLAFDFQLTDRIDTAPWDVAMDWVAAESGAFARRTVSKENKP